MAIEQTGDRVIYQETRYLYGTQYLIRPILSNIKGIRLYEASKF